MDLILPNFLGIGAPRAGTTWLHEVLKAHPEVLMPSRRKELGFFDKHFHRGLEWYAASFDAAETSRPPKAVGEVTPVYMYEQDCRMRIREVDSIERFIVCLRDPVDLLMSGYRQNSAIFNFSGDLGEFIEAFPEVVANGFYAQTLRPWFDEFGRDRFLLLDFDDIVNRPERAIDRLSAFLEVERELFDVGVAETRWNHSVTPRFPRLHSSAKRATTWLHGSDLTWVVGLAKKVGLRSLVNAPAHAEQDQLSDEQRADIRQLYADDLRELEEIAGIQVRTR